MGQMHLSICILTHSQPELLPKCVASCFAEIERAGVEGEVIIVDNASTDGSPQNVAAQFAGVCVIRNEENLGFSAANNKAIRASRGRYILILNDDAVLQEDSLRAMLAKLDSDPTLAAAGPRLVNPDGSLQIGYTHRRFPRLRTMLTEMIPFHFVLHRYAFIRSLLTDSHDMEVSGETDYVGGSCLLLRRSALEDVGLFDENFDYFFEDTDLCFRLKERAWRIFYLSTATVVHYGSSTFRRILKSRMAIPHCISMMYYFQKHASPLRRVVLRYSVAILVLLLLPEALIKFLCCRFSWSEVVESIRTSFQVVGLLLVGRS